MALEPWLYTSLAIAGLFHLVAVIYAWWKLEHADGQVSDVRTAHSGDGSEVTCPECGTDNERDYRFCGECVAELPGGGQIARRQTSPTGRQIF